MPKGTIFAMITFYCCFTESYLYKQHQQEYFVIIDLPICTVNDPLLGITQGEQENCKINSKGGSMRVNDAIEDNYKIDEGIEISIMYTK